MYSKNFPESNSVLRAPPDMAECHSLHVLRNDDVMVSRWVPTEKELEVLNNGGSIYFCVWGSAHPPVLPLAAHSATEALKIGMQDAH